MGDTPRSLAGCVALQLGTVKAVQITSEWLLHPIFKLAWRSIELARTASVVMMCRRGTTIAAIAPY
jgi:hypothetical protein